MNDFLAVTVTDPTPSPHELTGRGLQYIGESYRVPLTDYVCQVTPWTTRLVDLGQPFYDRRGVVWEPAPDHPTYRIDALDHSGEFVHVFLRRPFRKVGKKPVSTPRKPRRAGDDAEA